MAKRSKPASHTVLPRTSLPCVWMAAGLVAYKLCDRALDCEHCPLDAALRGAAPRDHTRPAVATGAESALPNTCEFPEDRRYHSGHAWARQMGADRVRCGIDAFAARLLEPIQSVVLPTPPARLVRGGVLCWLGDGTALVALRSPVDGEVLNVHVDIQGKPEQVASEPYGGGWLLDVHCPGGIDRKKHLLSASEQRERTQKQLARLERAVRSHLRAGAEVGTTLADGGERITDLRRQLGATRFHRLIRRVFRHRGV